MDHLAAANVDELARGGEFAALHVLVVRGNRYAGTTQYEGDDD